MGFFIEIGLSAIAAVMAWRLSRKALADEQLCLWLWGAAFACLGAGVLTAALYRQVLWLFPRLSSDLPFNMAHALQLLSNALSLCAIIVAYFGQRLRAAIFLLVVMKLVLFLALLSHARGFSAVVFDTALSALALLVLCAYDAWTWKYPQAKWIVMGAFLSLLSTLFHQGRVVRGSAFTADDFYHLMQMGVLLLFARGAWHLHDASASKLAKMAFKRVQWRS